VVDHIALKLAAGNLSGLMHHLVCTCSTRTIRTLAAAVDQCVDHHFTAAAGMSVRFTDVDKTDASSGYPGSGKAAATVLALCEAMKTTFGSLSEDERILASCLDTNWSFFDESLSWAMSRDQFQNNIVRWKLAWKGLLSIGWILHDVDLGFKCSYLASLVQPLNASSDQTLFDTYILHLAQEIVRMNDTCGDWSCALEHFGKFISHFNHVTACLFSKVRFANASDKDESFGIHFDHMLSDLTLHLFDSGRNIKSSKSNMSVQSNVGNSNGGGKGEVDREGDQFPSADSAKGVFGPPAGPKYSLDFYDEDHISQVTNNFTHPALVGATAGVSAQSAGGKNASSRDRFISPIVFVDCEYYQNRTRKPTEEAVAKVINILAGHLSNLLTYHTSPHTGRLLTQIVLNVPGAVVDPVRMSEALLDVCEQDIRNNEASSAMHHLTPLLTEIGSLLNNLAATPSESIPSYAPRALLVQGRLLHATNHLADSRKAFSNAIKLYQCRGMTAENNWQCALALSQHDLVCTAIASQPAVTSLVDLSLLTAAAGGPTKQAVATKNPAVSSRRSGSSPTTLPEGVKVKAGSKVAINNSAAGPTQKSRSWISRIFKKEK
jgi:hypothetical protein